MGNSIRYLGVEKRTMLGKLGNKEATLRKMWKSRMGSVKKLKLFERNYIKKAPRH